MAKLPKAHSRRDFLGRVGQLGAVAALPGYAVDSPAPVEPGNWDLSWIDQLKGTNDRALIDVVNLSDVALQLATRYLAPGTNPARRARCASSGGWSNFLASRVAA